MNNAYKTALLFTALIILWMLFGGLPEQNNSSTSSSPASHSEASAAAQTQHSTAQPVAPVLKLNGHVLPDRRVELRARTQGQVIKLHAEEGDSVTQDQTIVQLSMEDRQARLLQADSQLTQAQHRLEARQRLQQQGYSSQSSIHEANAAYQAAQAEKQRIELDIEHTRIKAPFSGIIAELPVEIGAAVSTGSPVATLVDNRRLQVEIYVPQQKVSSLQPQQPAQVTLATGQQLTGHIAFIAPTANTQDRTFRTTVILDNPQGLRSGISARVAIDLPTVAAHFISPGFIVLGPENQTGVHLVNANGIVEFQPVTIIKSRPDGVYISGLPSKARIVTVGTQMVSVGQQLQTERQP